MNWKVTVGFISIILLLTAGYYLRHPLYPKVRIGNSVFYLETALTPGEKEKGLGGRDSLKAGWGMLFPYDHKEKYTFWMKGMQFPLDFIWIADKKVIDLTQNVPLVTNGTITTISPSAPADQILELNAGEIRKNNIKIGDSVMYILK